jgi:hypothetical protein
MLSCRPSLLACLALLACRGGNKPLGLLGADCARDRDAACSSGQCLALDSSTAYCTQSCQSGTDCPQGFLCAQAASVSGKVCQSVGAGGVCGVDDDCPAGLKCDAAAARCYIPVSRGSCGPCTSDKQCGAGGSCHAELPGSERFCAPACGSGGACAAGYKCLSADGGQRCLPVSSAGTAGSCRGGRPLCAPCAGDLECGKPGDLCVRNLQSQETFCAVACAQTSDCPHGFSCSDLSGKGLGPSQCVPDSATCSGYCDSTDPATVQRECGLGSVCDLPNRACKRATDGSLCAACANDDDCTKASPSSRCVVNRTPGSPNLGEQFCGSDCSLNGCTGAGCQPDPRKCGSQFACTGIGPGGVWPYQCVPIRGSCRSGFGRLGDSCDKSGAGDCVSAICAQLGTERRCSAACSSDASCGDARWRCCAAVGADKYDCTKGPAAGASGVCAPVGGSFGDDCAAGSPPCQEGLCLDLGTAQLCTRGCDSAHPCAAGFSCQPGTLKQADGTLGTAVNVCFPDGGGGVGSACAFGPAACKTHLCLKKDSGNVCTLRCTTNTECPASWTCAEEAMPDGTKATVCLPPGTGA